MKSVRIVLLACAVLLSSSSIAFGQSDADKATARDLFHEGEAALKNKDCGGAADKFERADQLYQAPTITLGLARAYVCLGKFVKGREKYNLLIRWKLEPDAAPAFKDAVAAANKEIVGLEDKIGYVTITLVGPAPEAAKVTIDGEEVPAAALGVKRPVDPGQHVVKADGTGWKPGEATVTITAKQETPVTITLEADPDEVGDDDDDVGGGGTTTPSGGTGDTLRLVGFIGIGVGAAGLILGGVMGGLAIGKHGDLTDACGDNGQCPPDQQDNLDSFNTFGTVSTVGFIAGGVIAAAGVALVIVGSMGSSEEGAALVMTPNGFAVQGRF